MKKLARQRIAVMMIAGGVALVLSLLKTTSVNAASPFQGPSPICRDVSVATTIPARPVTIHGVLCEPFGRHPQTLQFLVHGGTYNASYWDFPGFGGKYSYVHDAVAAGYATLAIDRLGYGESSRPPSQEVTFDNEVDTTHAMVQAARSGALGIHVRKVEAIGHSLGSGTVVGEVAKYPQDFDAVILTGYGETVSPNVAKLNALYMTAANYLPRFSTLDPIYQTHKPDTRGLSGLYYTPLADPAVIAADQNTEDTVTRTEIISRPQGNGVQTAALKVPVLLVDGQFDSHYCLDNNLGPPDHVAAMCASSSAFWNAEKANYPNACFSAALVQSGHDINLHTTAQQSFGLLLAWSWATIPPIGVPAHCALRGPLP
jgi:pimeloyl-ACP methyl ester carboxylesterase